MTTIRSRRDSHRRSRGMSLVEVLAVVTLTGAFTVLAGEAFSMITSITRDSNRAQPAARRLDAIVRTLRADVWRAASIRTPDDSTVLLEFGVGQPVMWNISRERGVVVRVEMKSGNPATETTRREGFTLPIHFAARNGALVVTSTQQNPAVTDELLLVSQMKMGPWGKR